MFTLSANTRKDFGKKTKSMRSMGRIPGVVYGPGADNVAIEIDGKEFKKVFHQAGESSLIELQIGEEKKPVLVHEIQKDPLSGSIIHVDFFQASLKQAVEVTVPLVFEGVTSAEKDLGGTLMKNMTELPVKALPQNLPHEIVVSIENLKTFDDRIAVKDLKVSINVEILKNPDEIVASVLPPRNVEAELAEAIEEKVEEVEKVAKEEKEEEVVEEPVAEKKE